MRLDMRTNDRQNVHHHRKVGQPAPKLTDAKKELCHQGVEKRIFSAHSKKKEKNVTAHSKK